jgi:aldehyde:ferredoxin oxidoreductase
MSALGYDAIVLQGASSNLIFLEIDGGAVRFHDASFLRGKDALETERMLREQYEGNAAVLTIGPAGENLVKYAYVNNDQGRCLGRTGVGAVLGSKRVKALVLFGEHKKTADDPELLHRFQREILGKGKNSPSTAAFQAYGTSMIVDLTCHVEAFPSRYWQEGTVSHVEDINGEALMRTCDVEPKACGHCFIKCIRSTSIRDGRHKGLKVDGPEYETIYAFGGLNEVADIREIAYLNDMCDRLGMDTITAGNVTAFAIEAYKRNRIDFAVDYGQVDRIAELLRMIAYREGIGALLAEGVRAASLELGLEEIAIHVKGLEPPGYEPRYLQGMGLSYAVADRGACHLRGTFYKPELSGFIDPLSNEGKAQMLIDYEDRMTIMDTLILCRFYRDLVGWDEMSKIVQGTTGLRLSEADLRRIAADIAHTVRRFNLREGMTPEDDTLPGHFFNNPLGSRKVVLTRKRFEELRSDYYRIRGL